MVPLDVWVSIPVFSFAMKLAFFIQPSDLQSGRHESSMEKTCTAYTIVTATYQTAHVGQNSFCQFITAPFGLLESYLTKGAIPVLNLDATL